MRGYSVISSVLEHQKGWTAGRFREASVLSDVRLVRESISQMLEIEFKPIHVQSLPTAEIQWARGPILLDPRTTHLCRVFQHAHANGSPVICFAVPTNSRSVLGLLREGASALLPVDADIGVLGRAIDAAVLGERWIAPELATYVLDDLARGRSAFRTPHLTPRELEISRLIQRGFANATIASELHLEHQSVKNHVRRILRKLNGTSRADIVRMLDVLDVETLSVGGLATLRYLGTNRGTPE